MLRATGSFADEIDSRLYRNDDTIDNDDSIDNLMADTAHRIDAVSKKASSLFISKIDNISEDTYLALLEDAHMQSLENTPANLELFGDCIRFKPAMAASAKIMVAFAIILLVLVVTSAIFITLLIIGTITIPGIDQEMAIEIAKYLGGAIIAASVSYSLVGIGYLGGYKSGLHTKGGESKAILNLNASKLRKAAKVHKEVWKDLTKSHNEMQHYASELMNLINVSCNRHAKYLSEIDDLKHSSEEKGNRLTKAVEENMAIAKESKTIAEENEDIIGQIRCKLLRINGSTKDNSKR